MVIILLELYKISVGYVNSKLPVGIHRKGCLFAPQFNLSNNCENLNQIHLLLTLQKFEVNQASW